MNKQKLSDLVQLLTALTLVAGIALVVWELRQSREFVSVDLVDRTLTEILESRRAKIGEDPLRAYARACNSEDLSIQDKLVLENYFFMQMALVVRINATYQEFGGSAPSGMKIGARNILSEVFRLEEGHRFFERFTEQAKSSQDPAVDEVLRLGNELKKQVKPCAESLDYLQSEN